MPYHTASICAVFLLYVPYCVTPKHILNYNVFRRSDKFGQFEVHENVIALEKLHVLKRAEKYG